MVQGGRRRREAGRQPVRDRDRQGVDGGAVDHRRHADRDQGAGRRDRAGRRRGRGDRGRGRRGCERAGAKAPPPRRSRRRHKLRSLPRKREPSGQRLGPRFAGTNGAAASFAYASSIRSSRCARRRAISARRKLAGGTFVTPLARRLAGENGIDLSRMSGSGPHGRIVAADVEAAIAKGGGRAAPMATGASAPRRSRRSTRASSSRRCRSTACARPSRAGWSRPSRPSRISISSPT